jgi:hypothetical protein
VGQYYYYNENTGNGMRIKMGAVIYPVGAGEPCGGRGYQST